MRVPAGDRGGLERFAPAEREGAVAPGTLTLTIPFWKLCRATPLTPVERPPPGKPGPSTPLLPKRKPRRGKRGFQQRTALGGSGGISVRSVSACSARSIPEAMLERALFFIR